MTRPPSFLKLLCTVGPATLTPAVLPKLERLGVNLLRVNLSHTAQADVAGVIARIRSMTAIPVCLDTEGPQIRTGQMSGGRVAVRRGAVVRLAPEAVPGTAEAFSLTPREAFGGLEPGTTIDVDFHGARLKVMARERAGAVLAKVLRSGIVGTNRGVVASAAIALPQFTDKDRAALAVGAREGITTYALSFAQHAEAVRELRRAMPSPVTVIAKIESRSGLAHLEEIVREADALLIDRGDFSREVPLEELPRLQRMIIATAHRRPIPVYVATNLLDSMVREPRPLRPEVNDLLNILEDGANGLVLAAETAIGRYPVQCVRMVRRLMDWHEAGSRRRGARKSSVRIAQLA